MSKNFFLSSLGIFLVGALRAWSIIEKNSFLSNFIVIVSIGNIFDAKLQYILNNVMRFNKLSCWIIRYIGIANKKEEILLVLPLFDMDI